MKTIVVINEQHKLLPEQETKVRDKFGAFEFFKVPAKGMTIKEQEAKVREFANSQEEINIAFVSPIPVLLAGTAFFSGYGWAGTDEGGAALAGSNIKSVYVFANDKRDKKEVNGKIISVIAQTGWQLVEV